MVADVGSLTKTWVCARWEKLYMLFILSTFDCVYLFGENSCLLRVFVSPSRNFFFFLVSADSSGESIREKWGVSGTVHAQKVWYIL